jgi:hypothetical protein
MRRLIAHLAVLVLLVVFALPAHADFSGYYAPANWTELNQGGGAIDFSAPGSVQITGGYGGENITIVAPASGTVSFSYDFDDDGNGGPFVDMENVGPVTAVENTIAYSGSGTYSFTVTQGETFGFDVGDSGYGNGPSATISDFSAPLPTPEPCTLTLLGIGSLTLGLLRRKRA